jgi:hypothetical protein
MANFDQLPAQQKAIIELVLRRGKTYEDLADMLGMPEARVRDLAREALSELSPRSAGRVDEDWRGQVADYILGQQSGPESNATKGHMKRSEAARAWAYSLLDALDDLYENGDQPVIPDADAGGRRRSSGRQAAPATAAAKSGAKKPKRERVDEDEDEEDDDRPRSALSPEAGRVVRRRRIIAAAAGVLALIATLLVVFVWSPWSDDGKKKKTSSSQQASARIVKRVVLQPTDKSDRTSAGIAVIGEQGGKLSLIVTAQLPKNKKTEAYEVWLYNNKKDAVSLGAQQTDASGIYQGAGPLPNDYEKYKYFDISREKIDRNPAHSGISVLRGEIAAASTEQSGGAGPTGTDTQPQVVTP